jgi:hypothetical protein
MNRIKTLGVSLQNKALSVLGFGETEQMFWTMYAALAFI